MATPSLGERLCALLDGAAEAAGEGAAAAGPAAVVCSGPLTRIDPCLEMPAAGGRISLPLQPAQVAALKAACTLAPFGHGEETRTDTAVRHTWQLDPAAFELASPREEAGAETACDEGGVRVSQLQQAPCTAPPSPATAPAPAGWQDEVVPEAVRRAKAALGIHHNTGKHVTTAMPCLGVRVWRAARPACVCKLLTWPLLPWLARSGGCPPVQAAAV